MTRLKVMVLGVTAAVLTVCSGCNVKPEQIKAVAQQAGLFSAVGWIATDNPDDDTIQSVKSILVIIEEKSGDVEGGATYTEVIYPEVEKVINSDAIPAQYRPACKVATITLLGGLDMLFAANPEWKEKQDIAISVVDAFIFGAKNGLNLSNDHKLITAARNTASRRAKVYQK